MTSHRLRSACRTWLRRYLAPELLGTAASVAGAWFAFGQSGSLAVAAVVGTLAEGIGYYAIVVVRAARGHRASADVLAMRRPLRRGSLVAIRTVRSVAAEFGPAEVVDTVLVRPLLLWAVPAALGAAPVAWLIGKLASDIVFYAITITSFELGKRIILPHPKAHAS